MARPEQAANKVLEECHILAPPVPVESIAQKLGARVLFERFGSDVSGILYRDGDTAVIGVNEAHTKTRQRFTIAHEIGHLRLHQAQPMFVDHSVRIDRRDRNASRGADPAEIAANTFAAALLMPAEMVTSAMDDPAHRVRTSGNFIQRLAARFEVSTQAMEYRLANLGLVDPPH